MRIWGKNDFPDATFVPLRFGLIAIPFFCMLSFSMDQATQFKTERDQARAELEEVLHEVENIDKRIGLLRKDMHERELQLHEQYRRLSERPAIWPDEVVKKSPVTIPTRFRR